MVNNEHKVSIIVPVYNDEKYLERCIDSIINQTYHNVEVIIVNDGSTDKSSMICHQYEKTDSRIKVFDIENGGVSNARNFALNKVQGDLCMFVDADDFIDHKMVEIMITAMDKYKVKLVTCMDDFGYLGSPKEQIICVDKYSFQSSYGHPISWGVLYDTNLIKGLNFATDLYVGEDSLFFAQALNRCNKILHLNIVLYHYVRYPESAMHGTYDMKKYTEIVAWKRIVNEFSNRPQEMKNNMYISYVRRCYWGVIRADKSFNKDKFNEMFKVVKFNKIVVNDRAEKINYFLVSKLGIPYIRFYQFIRKIAKGR